jgi:trans-aconitate 2-methyltransferase
VITYARMQKPREWDGTSYDRISATMEGLGRAVLDRLELTGDEVVIDAGCGSGRITQALLERLPRGHVIAVDASTSMVEAAHRRLAGVPGSGEGSVELRLADLLELELPERVGAILSTATFHWIADHERLFARLRELLRDGGRLVAQCGGVGNIDVLRGRAREVQRREPYVAHFDGWRPPWNYAAPEQTRERLLGAGFSEANCWLQEAPRQPEQPREFLSTIVLGPHVQLLPGELRGPFMDDVMAVLEKPVTVDYVRLNIAATA